MEPKCPDKIFYNGIIHTMSPGNRICEAMAVSDGKITAIGTDEEILALKKTETRLYDLKKHTVIPGLTDTHTHVFRVGLSELKQEVFIPSSVEELLEYTRLKAQTLPPGEWIYFPNTYPTRLKEYRFPTLEELDNAAPNHPVYVDGAYAGQANSYALRMAGIDENTPQPPAGKIMKDKATGKPNGLLFLCGNLVKKHMKPGSHSFEDLKKGIINFQERYHRLGITSVIDGITEKEDIEAVNELYNQGSLNLRIVYTALVSSGMNASEYAEELREAVKTPSHWAKLRFLKVLLDGGILTGTAYMRRPYRDQIGVFGIDIEDFRGIVNYNSEQLVEIIATAYELGLQMTAHSIGDAATDVLLDAYETYARHHDITDRRFSIIHGDFTDRKTLERIRALNLTLLFQPAWHYRDGHILSKVLDEDVIRSFLPYRCFVGQGIMAAAGSDHMIKYDPIKSQNPYNPFIALYNMVTRKTEKGEVIGGDQTISREDALRMYTVNAAYATFDETYKGTLEAGKAADFAVLSHDYFNCPPDEIPEITSVLTVVDGKIVHNKM